MSEPVSLVADLGVGVHTEHMQKAEGPRGENQTLPTLTLSAPAAGSRSYRGTNGGHRHPRTAVLKSMSSRVRCPSSKNALPFTTEEPDLAGHRLLTCEVGMTGGSTLDARAFKIFKGYIS